MTASFYKSEMTNGKEMTLMELMNVFKIKGERKPWSKDCAQV